MRHLLGNAVLRHGSSKANVGRLTVGLLILLLPAMARAHAGGADAGLAGALMHPVSGLDHLLAMISVGVVSVQLGSANVWRIPATFICAMAAGTALGIAQWLLPHVELGIAASVLVLGLGIVVARRHVPAWPIIAMVLIFGACHGYAHGLEIPGSANPALFTLGLLISTSALHVCGVLVGQLTTRQSWLGRGIRLAGGVVAASGVAFLLQALGGIA